MSVPHDVSMRQLRRRFGCLSKLLSQEEDSEHLATGWALQDEEILAAFQKIKLVFDELRAAKSCKGDV